MGECYDNASKEAESMLKSAGEIKSKTIISNF